MSAPAAHQIGAPSTIFSDEASDRELFVSKFDHTPFEFRHRFHESDLFQMPALLRLAERAMQKKNRSHYESGQAAMTGYFGAPPPDVSIVQALEGIADGRNWVILKRIHEEPGYRELLESCTDELSNLSGLDLRRDYFDPIVTVFITSPGRVTPYHMDSEANFLAQAHGRKTVHLYDGNNRNVLSLQDLERFWTGHHDAAKYRDELERHCWKFELVPGTGVFNPATFPHWVQNGNDVSVSVSINYKRVKRPDVSAYRLNHYTRKMGLRPTDPGKSPALDNLKHITFGKPYDGLRSMRRFARNRFGV